MKSIKDYCELLGIDTGATPSQLKQAYRDLITVWHPDRFAHSVRLQQKAQEKVKEINEAYDQLKAFFSDRPTQTEPSTPNQSGHTENSFAPPEFERPNAQRTTVRIDLSMRHMFAQLADLIDPLNKILRQNNVQEDAKVWFGTGLFNVGVRIASIDGEISESEVNVIMGMYLIMTGNEDQDVDLRESQSSLREIAGMPDITNALNKPVRFVGALLAYDSLYGTDYGSLAKWIVLRFANLIVEADGKLTFEESEALKELESHLDSHIALS
jgi:hypothetical protein